MFILSKSVNCYFREISMSNLRLQERQNDEYISNCSTDCSKTVSLDWFVYYHNRNDKLFPDNLLINYFYLRVWKSQKLNGMQLSISWSLWFWRWSIISCFRNKNSCPRDIVYNILYSWSQRDGTNQIPSVTVLRFVKDFTPLTLL